jgi:hypothetical protein
VKPTIKIDAREFQRTLREYATWSKKGFAEIINDKAFRMAKAASFFNLKANRVAIRSDLLSDGDADSPKAAAIINSALKYGGPMGDRIAKMVGEPVGRGLFGAKMREAEKKFIQKMVGAASFMSSGWLPAVALFGRAAGKNQFGKNAIRAERKKLGGGKLAKPGANPIATLWNVAFSKPENTSNPSSIKYAESALQQAMTQETASMQKYIERKMQQRADQLAKRLFR